MSRPGINLVTREVEALSPYARNCRTHDEAQVAQIAESIKEFGFTNPVLIDEQNTIIAGEGRVLAATKLRLKTVPCIVLSGLNEAQKSAYVIADNKLALGSGWDTALLASELDRLADSDFAISLTGFSEVEFAALCEALDIQCSVTSPATGAQDDWSGMPDFHQPSNKPFRTIQLHFNDQAAVNAYAKLVGKTITDKTKSVWYPDRPQAANVGVQYV